MIRNSKKEFGNLEVIVLVVLTCIISVGMTTLWNYKFGLVDHKEETDKNSNDVIAVTDEMKKFIDNYNYFIENYYGQVDEKKLLEAAFKAITEASGDDFTEYFDENQVEQFNIQLNGYFTGIGVEIWHSNDNYINVLSVFPDSPASKAGLLAGDKILSVNGIDVSNKTTAEVRDMIKNNNGDDFTIQYQRDSVTKSVDIKRSNINIQSVHSSMMDEAKKIGYIKVDIFASNTDTQFTTALNNLENSGMKSLILDLRGNSGGHLNVVTNMVSRFMKNNKVIYQIVSKDETKKIYSNGLIDKKYPIVILVDSGSASASELMSATLREQNSAVLVGTTTFGKSTIQEVKGYSSDTEYKITTKEWLTPNSVRLNKVGLTPDYEVKLSDAYTNNPITANDNQLSKALEILNK